MRNPSCWASYLRCRNEVYRESTCSCAGHSQILGFAAMANDVVSSTVQALQCKPYRGQVICNWRSQAQGDCPYFNSYAVPVRNTQDSPELLSSRQNPHLPLIRSGLLIKLYGLYCIYICRTDALLDSPQKAPLSVWFQSIWTCFRLTSVHFVRLNSWYKVFRNFLDYLSMSVVFLGSKMCYKM